MKSYSSFLAVLFLLLPFWTFAQITPEDGDWAERYVVLVNTPQADLMARTGDIDNLGFGWPTNFDPFSGNNTPSHSFPWAPDSTDVQGLDRVLVLSSYNGSPPAGRDGYARTTDRPANSVVPVTVAWPAGSISQIDSALLQIFVDDFQAPVWQADYQMRLDGVRVPVMENVINSLQQTGPIGRIVNLPIPGNLLYLLADDSLTILIDDSTTGAGDGFALDFVKILVNPTNISQTGIVTGTIRDDSTQDLLSGVRVTANGLVSDTTDSSGVYSIQGVLAGLVTLETYKAGYGSVTQRSQIATGQTATVNFSLQAPAPQIISVAPANGMTMVAVNTTLVVDFNSAMDTASINTNSFIVTGGQNTISGSITYNGNQVVFTPTQTLEPGLVFSATLTTEVTDESGVAIERSFSWSFTTEQPTGISELRENVSEIFVLEQNYPNPFNPSTTIRFTLTEAAALTLSIFTPDGRLVQILDSGNYSVGQHQVIWNSKGFASGIYLYRLSSSAAVQTRKMMLLK
ncbi:MAG: Ig-like domain-containing protein [Calditrichia bacterium]